MIQRHVREPRYSRRRRPNPPAFCPVAPDGHLFVIGYLRIRCHVFTKFSRATSYAVTPRNTPAAVPRGICRLAGGNCARQEGARRPGGTEHYSGISGRWPAALSSRLCQSSWRRNRTFFARWARRSRDRRCPHQGCWRGCSPGRRRARHARRRPRRRANLARSRPLHRHQLDETPRRPRHTLVRFQPDSVDLAPGLALSWDISPDLLPYTFKRPPAGGSVRLSAAPLCQRPVRRRRRGHARRRDGRNPATARAPARRRRSSNQPRDECNAMTVQSVGVTIQSVGVTGHSRPPLRLRCALVRRGNGFCSPPCAAALRTGRVPAHPAGVTVQSRRVTVQSSRRDGPMRPRDGPIREA